MILSKKTRIAFVEYDKRDYELFRDAVREIDSNISTDYINDGSVVIPALKSKKPDLVFLDTNFPAFDSFAWLQQIWRDSEISSVKVIVYSDRNYEKIRLAFGLGAHRFLIKPKTLQSAVMGVGLVLGLFHENALWVDNLRQFVIDTY